MPTQAANQAADSARSPSPTAPRALLPALFVVVTAWTLLATQSLLAPRIGRAAAVVVSFLAVTALVIATRGRPSEPAPRRAAALAALGALAGFASFPAWIAAIAVIGSLLGLRPVPPPPRPDDPLLLFSVLALAPVFEELLYRERLLLALRERVGAGLAIAISSACFALPHLEPWAMLATGSVGLALGVAMLKTRSVALCIGLHAGLNLAAVVCGIPPVRFALPIALSLAGGAAMLAVAVVVSQRRLFGVGASGGH